MSTPSSEEESKTISPATMYSEEEIPLWVERETCFISMNEQGGKIWMDNRIGCIQASLVSQICERTFHTEAFPKKSPKELARTLCGLSKSSFRPSQKLAMEAGVLGEPIVREWFSNEIDRPITEVGVAVWKEDPFFRASLDGETTDEDGKPSAIEIKVPKKLNYKYREVFHSWGKGVNNPHPESYIFSNHYDQMTMGSVITNKNGCYYVVACMNEGTSFSQYINTDWELWNNTLYPKAKAFHEKYVIPMIKKKNISVTSPPESEM
jgi:hypothetical protein